MQTFHNFAFYDTKRSGLIGPLQKFIFKSHLFI